MAINQAKIAFEQEEVPVGAVIVRGGKIIGRGYNLTRTDKDPSAHAEMVALRDAARVCDNYRLPGSTLYVTLEPCTMCAGAMIHARVELLVFAAREPRAGVVCSTCALLDEPRFNHAVKWREGVLAEDSSRRLREFFRARR